MSAVYLFSFVLLMAGFCHSAVVEEADENRAIDMVTQMMRNLTRENPRRINNVRMPQLEGTRGVLYSRLQ